jgi:hypothetical protein
MICGNCGKQSSRIKILSDGTEYCSHCGGFSEAGGPRVDGVLTRNRFSIKSDMDKHAVDTIPPHIYDKASKKPVLNPDFARNYPEKLGDYFSPKEIKKAGFKPKKKG